MSSEDKKKKALEALESILAPRDQRSIVSLGWVKNFRLCGNNLAFELELPLSDEERREEIKKLCEAKALTVEGIDHVSVKAAFLPPSEKPVGALALEDSPLKGVKYVLAVASGKGGVGKSTMATNIAVSLMDRGYKTGLLDCDIYGPSIPLMLGLEDVEPTMTMAGKLLPAKYDTLKVMSVGIIAQEDAPLIWRGPMVTQLTQQFLSQVEWGELDFLVLDLPPGTGDVQITLCQFVPISGAVIVTTPQDVCFSIARKALNMFNRLKVPTLGLIENMSVFVCSGCQKETAIFGLPHLETFCQEEGIPFLGKVPLESSVVRGGDEGKPIVKSAPEAPSAQAIGAVMDKILDQTRGQMEEWEKMEKFAFGIREIRQAIPTELEILWTDGLPSKYECYELRAACTCALCIDEWTGEVMVDKKEVSLDIYPLQIKRIGNYALQFEWSDGHKTGIYTLEHLREMSEVRSESQPEAFEI